MLQIIVYFHFVSLYWVLKMSLPSMYFLEIVLWFKENMIVLCIALLFS